MIEYPKMIYRRDGSGEIEWKIIVSADEREDGWYDSPADVPPAEEPRKRGRPPKVTNDHDE